MRLSSLALPLLLFAMPAAAQPAPDEDIARALPSPGELDAIGSTLGRVVSALMDVRIDGLGEAIDPDWQNAHQHERTLGDLARRDDPYAEERMRRSVDVATSHMGEVMTDIAILTPRLRHSLENLQRDVEDATRDLPRRDYRD